MFWIMKGGWVLFSFILDAAVFIWTCDGSNGGVFFKCEQIGYQATQQELVQIKDIFSLERPPLGALKGDEGRGNPLQALTDWTVDYSVDICFKQEVSSIWKSSYCSIKMVGNSRVNVGEYFCVC